MAINKVIVIGNLGANPVVRTLPNSEQNVANFSLATTERFMDRNGTKQERTEWHRVVALGRLADTCERFLSKGRQVYVEGRLTTRQYEAKDGSGKRYRTEIVARQIRFLDKSADAPAMLKDHGNVWFALSVKEFDGLVGITPFCAMAVPLARALIQPF